MVYAAPMTKGTNPLGKGTKNLVVNLSIALHEKLGHLAKRSGLKLGQYSRSILQDAADREVEFRIVAHGRAGSAAAPEAGKTRKR